MNESWLVTRGKVYKFFTDSLKITDSGKIAFQRCHRMGPKMDSKGRDIIVRFQSFGDREMVWGKRKSLKGTSFILKEDFPREIEAWRSRLYPILKAAWNDHQKATLIVDKLIIEGRRYDINSLQNLPENLQPVNLSTKITDSMILFHGKDSFLSNFYDAPFELDGIKYTGSEQYYQYSKAKHSGNDMIAAEILATPNPVEQMKLGRSLKPETDQWNNTLSESIMEAGIKAKFQQNPSLRQKLLKTGNRELVECNRHDIYWSNGLSLYNEDAPDKNKWVGKNILGNILTNVRNELN